MGVVPARCSTTARCAAYQEDFPFPLPCIFGVRSFCRPCHNTAAATVYRQGSPRMVLLPTGFVDKTVRGAQDGEADVGAEAGADGGRGEGAADG